MSNQILARRPNWKEIHTPLVGTRAFAWGYVRVIVGEEPVVGWHMSISTPHRLPTWEEVREARYAFVPDEVTMAMLLPPRNEYMNIHEYCLHLYQVPGDVPMGLFSGYRKILQP
jgi:hypothetical protein